MGGVSALVDLIDLITSADFNRLLIDLKLAIINFRISADSQPYFLNSYPTSHEKLSLSQVDSNVRSVTQHVKEVMCA